MKEKFIVSCIDNGITVSLLSLAFVLPFSRTAGYQSAAYLTAALLWGLKLAIERKGHISITPLFLPFLGFGIMVLFSVFTATSFRYSLHEFRGEFGTYLLIFYLSSNNIKETKKVFWLLLILFSSSLIISTYGIIEYFYNGGRSSSLMADSNYLSAFLVMVFPFSISFWFLKAFSNRWARICFGLLSLLIIACLLFTLSRGAWLACLAELIVLVIFCWKSRKPVVSLSRVKTGLKMLLICLVVVFLVSTFTLDRAKTIAKIPWHGPDSSGQKRINIWKFGLSQISMHPFSGIGYGKYSLDKLFPVQNEVKEARHMHNIFLETALETGVPGMVCFIWLLLVLGSNLKDSYRNSQEVFLKAFFLASFLALVGYMVRCQFDHLYVDNLVRLFWLLMGAAIGIKDRYRIDI